MKFLPKKIQTYGMEYIALLMGPTWEKIRANYIILEFKGNFLSYPSWVMAFYSWFGFVEAAFLLSM